MHCKGIIAIDPCAKAGFDDDDILEEKAILGEIDMIAAHDGRYLRRLRAQYEEHGGDMCTNGVNTGQLELMIEQIDDHLKLERRWTHNLAHTAQDASFETVSDKLHEAQAALDDVRALLDEAKDAIEDDAQSAAGVTVNLA